MVINPCDLVLSKENKLLIMLFNAVIYYCFVRNCIVPCHENPKPPSLPFKLSDTSVLFNNTFTSLTLTSDTALTHTLAFSVSL